MKKNPENIDLDFRPKNPKFPKAIVWRKKLGEMATAGDVQILA